MNKAQDVDILQTDEGEFWKADVRKGYGSERISISGQMSWFFLEISGDALL